MTDADGAVAINMSAIEYNYKNLKNNFSREDLENLLLKENYTYRELQEKYKYNERLWSKLAKEYNIPKQYKNISKKLKINFSNEDDTKLIDLYENKKMSLRELEKIFGYNRSVIKNRLVELNINIRSFDDKAYYGSRQYKKAQLYLDTSGYMHLDQNREHRLIMEKYIGRTLLSDETVHHIDFNKLNNDVENLFIFSDNKTHLSYHGYIKNHDYVLPQEFVERIYPKILYYESKDFLYEQYIILDKSISQINKEIDNFVSRTLLSKRLKEYGFFVDNKHINQYD